MKKKLVKYYYYHQWNKIQLLKQCHMYTFINNKLNKYIVKKYFKNVTDKCL